jgi:hypothetical protein
MKMLLGLARLSLAALCAWSLTGSPAAQIAPDLNLRRTELVQLLPYHDVSQLHQWVAQQPLLLSPSQYMQRLQQRFPATSVAWTFYAGWSYLDLLEQTRRRYLKRADDLDNARAWLEDYERRVNVALRANLEPSPAKTLRIEEAKNQPEMSQDDEKLTVFRSLPWPEMGFDRSQVLLLLEACQQDLQRVEQQRLKLETAQEQFARQQNCWAEWLSDMAQASQKFTQSEYLKPYGDPLPLPPNDPLP